MGLYLAATAGAASAHFASADVGGICPHFSVSSHANGAFVATLQPVYNKNDPVCIEARIKVRGLNIAGSAPGWQTRPYEGDPGRLATGWADDILWTKHDVYIQYGPYNGWYGLTLWH